MLRYIMIISDYSDYVTEHYDSDYSDYVTEHYDNK